MALFLRNKSALLIEQGEIHLQSFYTHTHHVRFKIRLRKICLLKILSFKRSIYSFFFNVIVDIGG